MLAAAGAAPGSRTVLFAWASVISAAFQLFSLYKGTSPGISRYPELSCRLRKEKPKQLREGYSLSFKQVFFSLLQFSSGFISFFFFHIKLRFKSFSLLFNFCLHLYHLIRGNFLFAFGTRQGKQISSQKTKTVYILWHFFQVQIQYLHLTYLIRCQLQARHNSVFQIPF